MHRSRLAAEVTQLHTYTRSTSDRPTGCRIGTTTDSQGSHRCSGKEEEDGPGKNELKEQKSQRSNANVEDTGVDTENYALEVSALGTLKSDA